jgi:hypothetical protein
VVDVLETDLARLIARRDLTESGKEESVVVATFDERMDRVAVRSDRRNDYLAIIVAHDVRLLLRNRASLHGGRVRVTRVVHPQRVILHAVAMLVQVLGDRRARR